ncbi:HTTM domain-containing protein [Patiriisocius hiemis]|uniref:HTTM domain-containing protein n=1 Tax=Patiriisocius hiemis TaxID=3075604 RepID=A0ABU2YEV0_9FLAO|nr:HTTM domain-containing protein [Constantimarinum sp. W242]MDT0556718.1 HTTM domain-containing protein [Constantimarinum sp. W242]
MTYTLLKMGANVTLPKVYYYLFTFFVVALLMGYGSNSWIYPALVVALIISLLLLIFKQKFWLISFFIASIAVLLYGFSFPRMANHGNLEFFIGLFIICFLLLKYKDIKNNTLSVKNITWFFRFSLLSIYFFAGFHKLNSGFFSINESCTFLINQGFFSTEILTNTTIALVFQVGTILIEMLIPFGLLFRKTRKIAVLILLAFHIYLSFVGFSNFSSLAGFLLLGSLLSLKKIKQKHLIIYTVSAVIAVITGFVLRNYTTLSFYKIAFINGLIYNIGWVYFFYNLVKGIKFNTKNLQLSWQLAIPVFFVFLWSSQAYIGLSNTGNLTMFSNLITESSRSNHFLINTKKTKLFFFEDDYVTILELPDYCKWNGIEKLEGYDLPYIEFKTQVGFWKQKYNNPIPATVVYKKDTLQIDNLKNSTFSTTNWWHKYLHFRKIPIKGNNECLW